MTQQEIFGEGKFVKASSDCLSPCFRGTFNSKKGAKTKITICGLGFFKLFINGENPTDDIFAPVTSFYHEYEDLYCKKMFGEELASRVYAVEYDITDYVKDGVNSVCAVVGHAWYFKEFYGDCVLCYKIESDDEVTYSDSSLKWIDSPLILNKDKELENTFYQMKRGETHDYTKHKYDGSWILPDFDDEGWTNVVETQLPETQYYIQDCPNDKIIRSIEPELIKETEEYKVYDFGENISGWYIFKCEKYGEKVTVTVGEEVDETNDRDMRYAAEQMSQYICDGSDREYHPLFTWQGFRYVRITNNAELIRCDVIHTDAPVKSDFKSENKVLNWIYDAYIRTQLCNLHAGIPSDCPHIERLGYTGDGQLTCETAMLTIELRKFYLKWMEDISDCQDRKSGNVQYTAPYWKCGGGPGGWGCAIAEVPYKFYKMTGDIGPMKKYYHQSLHYLEYLENHSENDLVVSGQPGLWWLGEWCQPHELNQNKPDIPDPLVNTYFYVRTIDRLIETAEITGNEKYVEELKNTRKRKIDALVKNYYDEKTGNFANNFNSANAFAIDMGLGDERTMKNLVEGVKNNPLNTGIFGTELVAKVLFENGYGEIETELLSREEYPSFGNMMKNGSTTIWEEWQNTRSMSHPMFGSVTKYFFYYLLGIRQDKNSVGFEKLIIDPQPNKYSGDVEGYIELDNGKLKVRTDMKNNCCVVEIPDGINAYKIDNGKEVRLEVGKNIIKI